MPEIHIPRDHSVPAAVQFKNPGAMWPGTIATKWGSTKWQYLSDGTGQGGGGKGNKIAIFDSWVMGIAAQLDLWRTSPNYRGKRFADAIHIWDGGNNTPSYISYVKARVPGITEGTVMDDKFWAGPMAIPFLKAQAAHEAGKVIPAPAGDWVTAQNLVMGGKAPASPTKKTVATAAVTNTTTVATATAAAQSGFPWWTVFLVIAVGIGITVFAAWFFNRGSEEHEEIHTPAVKISLPEGGV